MSVPGGLYVIWTAVWAGVLPPESSGSRRRVSRPGKRHIRLTLEHELGDRVEVDVYDGSSVQRKTLVLWHPGRRISRVSLGPLLNYEASAQNATTSFTFIDLWLFSVYQYGQSGGERTHKLLSIFEFASDYGELIEEPQP